MHNDPTGTCRNRRKSEIKPFPKSVVACQTLPTLAHCSRKFFLLIYIPKPPVAVCKRWERLTGDDTLWKRLDLGLAAVPAGACWVNGSCTFSQSFYIVNHLKVSLAQSCQGVALYCGWLGRLWLKIFSLLRSQTRSGDKSD